MSSWGDSNFLIGSRLDRPSSIQTAIKQKEGERQEILAAVEAFKASGGAITVIPTTISKDAQLMQMRKGEVELISFADIAKRWGLQPKSLPPVMAKWPTLMYVMHGQERMYCLDDIRRLEETPNHKLNYSVISKRRQ